METIVRWFARNHVAANFLMFMIVLAGTTTWGGLRMEIFPETSFDAIQIQVPFPAATPDEVESGICIPIEEAIADVDGIERVTSTSAESMGVVVVEVASGYPLRQVMDDVKGRVDAIENLAENAERPVFSEILLKREALSVVVSADTDEQTLRELSERVRDDLLDYRPSIPPSALQELRALLRGDEAPPLRRMDNPVISQVTLSGVRPPEISIEVSEQTLLEYGLSFDEVARAVRGGSFDLPAGSLRTEAGEIMIRGAGRRYSADAFRDIVIRGNGDGSELLLGQIADVRDDFEEIDITMRFDGRPAVLVNVFRVGEEDTLAIADAVHAYMDEAPDLLPPGTRLEVWNDQSDFLKSRVDLLARNGLAGLVFVFIALTLFLRPSLAFLVALGIPVAFAGAILMMPYTGISLNMVSLFAFILVLGIVVDDAIVTGENVYRRIEAGELPSQAAWKGTQEVGVVVVFGILTTVIAFTPMLGLSGISGRIWENIPLIVIPVMVFSLVQSKLVLPSHLALLRKRDRDRKVGILTRVQRRVADGLQEFVKRVYSPVLAFALCWRYATISLFMGILAVIMGAVAGGFIKTEFFPAVEADVLSAKLNMPRGVSFDQTVEVLEQIERAAVALNERYIEEDGQPIFKHMLTSAGTQPFQTGIVAEPPKGSHLGEITVELRPAAQRKVLAEELAAEWREMTGPVAGASELSFLTLTAGGGQAIQLQITGHDLDELESVSQYIKDELAGFPGVIDIADSHVEGKQEIKIHELTPEGRSLGLTLANVSQQVRQAFFGEEIQRLQRGRDEVKVMLRYPESERQSVANLEGMRIRGSEPDEGGSGLEVPLTRVAEYDFATGFSVIQRSDRRRAITITADVDSAVANANEVVQAFTNEVLAGLRDHFPAVSWSFEGEQKEQREAFQEMGTGFMFALLGIFIVLAIPLRSYIQPFIIMSVIPFGVIGAVIGHMLFGLHLSIMSMVGIVALAGVVVNNSLVMVEYVNRHRVKGMPVFKATEAAGAARFRPIFLTSLTTIAGVTPMIFETDIQAIVLIPMAVALGAGIGFATLISLLLVPCVYLILEDIKNLLFKPERVEKMEERYRQRWEERSWETIEIDGKATGSLDY